MINLDGLSAWAAVLRVGFAAVLAVGVLFSWAPGAAAASLRAGPLVLTARLLASDNRTAPGG